MPAPTYRVIVLPQAIDDLDHITAYIRQSSPQNAALVFARLWAAARSLSALPHRYEIHRYRRYPAKAVRSMAVPPFIIYYRIDETARIVRILTIYHGARRQPRS